LQNAVRISVHFYGAGHPRVAESTHNLGIVYLMMGKDDDAHQHLARVRSRPSMPVPLPDGC
jgi:hypothetical protein